MLCRLCLILLSGFFTATTAAQGDVEKDTKALQGSWKVVGSQVNGVKISLEAFKKTVLVVKDGVIQFKDNGKVYDEIEFEIDTSKKPKEIDYRYSAGLKKGVRELGIYRIDGDDWVLCIAQQKQKRPTEFVSKQGPGHQLWKLKRINP